MMIAKSHDAIITAAVVLSVPVNPNSKHPNLIKSDGF